MYQLIDQLFKLAEKLLSCLPKVSEITGRAETIVDTMVTANSSNEAAVLNIMVEVTKIIFLQILDLGRSKDFQVRYRTSQMPVLGR